MRARRLSGWVLSLGTLLACATPEIPNLPARFEAVLPETVGRERTTRAFSPPVGGSRFCRVKEPEAGLGFDGSWTVRFASLCDKRARYGDCVCDARIQVEQEGQPVFVTDWRRFDVHNGSGWQRFQWEGHARELRLAYPSLERIVLEIRESATATPASEDRLKSVW